MLRTLRTRLALLLAPWLKAPPTYYTGAQTFASGSYDYCVKP